VVNLDHFRGALVFDKWVSNSDARQAIFFRRRIRDWVDREDVSPLQKGFVTQMVDHGFAFDGHHWEFADSPLQGLYLRPLVYHGVKSLDDFQPWLDWVRHFPELVLDTAWKEIPRSWVGEDESALERMLNQLLGRRRRVEDLLLATVRAKPQCFPHWLR